MLCLKAFLMNLSYSVRIQEKSMAVILCVMFSVPQRLTMLLVVSVQTWR